jgi:predicted dehydrogenase
VSDTAYKFRDLCSHHSGGHGVDAVLIAAETPSNDPVNLAAEIARDRGVVVAVGTVGMDIERKLYYGKELDFRVSRSYGPGRYDAAYEQQGRDYPIGYVRWTETRNMEAFLRLLAEGNLDLQPLITHRFPVERAQGAYDLITGRTGDSSLGVLITYSGRPEESRRLELVANEPRAIPDKEKFVAIGLLGAGNFATTTLIPAMKSTRGVQLVGVCSANGSDSRHAAGKFGFRFCATEEDKIVGDPSVNTVVIATRHHLHAAQVVNALHAGKHVFCEKPLCLREDELAGIVDAYSRASRKPLLMVGFNRRFAPMAVQMKSFLGQVHEPLVMHCRVNAGFLAPDHWINDLQQGGGRILGEVCHFVDFLSFLAGAPPVEVHTRGLDAPGDNVVLSLQFTNGSQGAISYLANGDKSYSKERLEVFGGGVVAVLEDFRRLELVRHGRRQVVRSRLRQDKGHCGEWEAFAAAIRAGGEAPIPFDEIVATTLATLRAVESRASGRPMTVDVTNFIGSHAYSQRTDS